MTESKTLSPKYWVLWDNTKNDIYVDTLSKSLIKSDEKARELYGANVLYSDIEKGLAEFKLIEILGV